MELSKGRIIFASKSSYTVSLVNNIEYFSVLSGSFNKNHDFLPAVGDYVMFYQNDNGDSLIEKILPRKSVISRKSSGRNFSANVLAANIDIMLIVCALDRTFSVRRIERFLVLARSGDVEPLIILSKSDICDPINRAVYLQEIEDIGVKAIEVSSVSGTGIEELEELLTDAVTVCAVGLSGAGKSTLLNRLSGVDIASVNSVRDYDSKGRHTTTSRHLYKLKSGASFVDTPGIREVGLTGDKEAVEQVFDEIVAFSGDCFFADCSHVHEPGCAVLKAVEEGAITRERYHSYLKLKRESDNYKARTEAPQEKKRADKNLSKLVRSVTKKKKRF